MMRRTVLLAAFAALLPCLAMAKGVSYTTSGTFSNPNLPITFVGTSVKNFVGGDMSFGHFEMSFGHFDMAGCFKRRCKETFTLQITETSPVSATEDLVGEVFFGRHHSHLTIIFNTASVTIGSTVYNISPVDRINLGNLGTKTLNGSVAPSIVPEPSAEFLLGMGAIGLMGLATVSRKMINA
jgi:hypothetical protein